MLLTHFIIFNTEENQDPTLDMEPTENTVLTEHGEWFKLNNLAAYAFHSSSLFKLK